MGALRRTGLGLLFFGWLYGTPFLLVVFMIRWRSVSAFASQVAEDRFATVTGRYLIAALILNGVAPMVGLLVAKLSRDGYWFRHFGGALAGVALYFVVVGGLADVARKPMFGPESHPDPSITQCIPRSGGHSCPGG